MTGLTSNPSIFDRAIASGTTYDESIRARSSERALSREQYIASAEVYLRGLERRIVAGLTPAIPSVASVFISRWDKAILDKVPPGLRNRLGIAVAKQTYRSYRDLLESPRWLRLANYGARPQRLLWASTGTKDPAAPEALYVETLAAPFAINTIPDQTLEAYADHGTLGEPMPRDGGDAETVLDGFAQASVDVPALAAQLQTDGAEAFDRSWRDLLACIESNARVSRPVDGGVFNRARAAERADHPGVYSHGILTVLE